MSKKSLKVLFIYRSDIDGNGGAAAVMIATCNALKDLGVQVEITYEQYPKTEGFDAVHVFNIWSPPAALAQLQHLRRCDIPVIWSPFYLHWCECAWANLAFELIYKQQTSLAEREKILNGYAAGTLEINGLGRWKPNEIYPGFHQTLKAMLLCVDHLCLASHSEIQKLSQVVENPTLPFMVTPHGVDALPFRNASPVPFVSRFGIKDFILCVGAVDRRKNQLMLVEALKGTSLPIVLIGPSYELDYLEVCKKEGGGRVVSTGRLNPDLVASAYKAASVHVLPSFAEGAALANLEAAVSECAMVVSNRSSEFEYFGDGPFYCSPNDPASIGKAVSYARQSALAEKERWEDLSRHVATNFTWKRTAELTLEAYERTVSRKSKRTLSQSLLSEPRKTRVSVTHAAGPREMTLPVLWSGPIFNPSGYADQARNFLRHMGHNRPIYLRPAGNQDSAFISGMDPAEYKALAERVRLPETPYISLLSMPAYAFQRDPNAVYNIGKTYFETDGLSPEWVSRCNVMDEVWVASEFNAETFRRSGVTVPLTTIPEGVDPDFYKPGEEPLAIAGRRAFAFLSVFEWTYRKGWDVLLKAWAEAFSAGDDVCLILRTYSTGGNGKTNPAREIEARIEEYFRSIGHSSDKTAPVIVLQDQVPQRLMPSLYAAADAFVLPSRGEGWGKPYLEAMSCGLPVIGTRWSANLAFMNDENSYLIETNGLERVDDKMELPFYTGQCWSSPSQCHLRQLMQYVFSNPEIARLKGSRARQDVLARWNWNISARSALSRLEEISSLCRGRMAGGPEKAASNDAGDSLHVRWEGLQFAYHSLALINRELCLRLIDAGHEVSILKFVPEEFGVEEDPRFKKLAARVHAPLSRPADIHVRNHFPPDFIPPPEGRWVMNQPWEYARLPEEWVEPMSNLVDEIWVPSRYVMKSFIASGIPSDLVQVVPCGVNTEIFNPHAKPYPVATAKKFKFLFVGGLIWRKGLDVLLKAFRQAFTNRDDVALVIKEIGQASFYQGMGSDDPIREVQQDPTAPEIVHIKEMLREEQMAGLLKSCDCLVHAYRGEGFALPVLEAMACGLPVAVTAGGPTDDFCSPDTAFLIPSQLRGFFSTRMKFAGGPGWVLEPDEVALVALLLHIYQNPQETARKAELGLERARTEYTWKAVADRVMERMRVLMSKPVRRRGL